MPWGLAFLAVRFSAGFTGGAAWGCCAGFTGGDTWGCCARVLSVDITFLLTSSSELSNSSLMGSSFLLSYEGNSIACLENSTLRQVDLCGLKASLVHISKTFLYEKILLQDFFLYLHLLQVKRFLRNREKNEHSHIPFSCCSSENCFLLLQSQKGSSCQTTSHQHRACDILHMTLQHENQWAVKGFLPAAGRPYKTICNSVG